MDFTDIQIERYSRHIILKEIGVEGQTKLLEGKVLVVGAGGLGSPAALYLAAAGVGTIGIIDGDVVDITNLQRQIIHTTSDINRPKVISAKEKIEKINPDVKVKAYHELLTSGNINNIFSEYDFILDGTDNFPTKFLINDACVFLGKPFSHGGILRFDGQTMTYTPGNTCYRCVFNSPPPKGLVPSCSQAGVLGSIAGMLGTIQATEALKYLTGIGELLTNRFLIFNALSMSFSSILFNRNDNCPVCGINPTITELKLEEMPVCELKQN